MGQRGLYFNDTGERVSAFAARSPSIFRPSYGTLAAEVWLVPDNDQWK